MRWEKIEDTEREAYLCEKTGWVVFKSNVEGYWIVFLIGQDDSQYGPYESEAEAKKWATRMQEMVERRADEAEEVDEDTHRILH